MMTKLTKLVLRRPVTALLTVLSLAFFGLMSLINSSIELTPDISMPMLIVMTTYTGASPKDVDELITKPIEADLNSLSSVDTITASSSENYSMVMIQYDYGTDMDNAYSDLRKKLDAAKSSLPEDAGDPYVFELDINALASMYIGVNNSAVESIYNYTESEIVPELEKLSSVSSVDIYGGNKEYVKVELIPEKMAQYGLDISTLKTLISAASFTMPAGSTNVGSTEMSISMGADFDTPEKILDIPITLGNGNIIYLRDLATVGRTEDAATTIGRYNGEDALLITVSRNTKYTAVDMSNAVKETLSELKSQNEHLDFIVIDDSADEINEAIYTMLKTMAIVVLISALVLFIFYGDIKASLIVGTSIPLSILTAFVMIWAFGYTFNVITLGSMIIAVGMMVDNSIVVLESCFRVREENPDDTFMGYVSSAVRGTDQVAASIFGGTVTTCVVFLPLGFISGLSGQFFQPLGFTIVFSMAASLISACSVVPLCYVYYRPAEKTMAPAYGVIRKMQAGYRELMKFILKHRKKTLFAAAALIALSLFAGTRLKTQLMPDIDEGAVQISIGFRPNLSIEKQRETLSKIEEIITGDEDLDKYLLEAGITGLSSGGATIYIYLDEDRTLSTDGHVAKWREELQTIDDCDIEVSAYSDMSMMNVGGGFSVSLTSADYDDLKDVSDIIYEALRQEPLVTAVTSSLADSSPVIKIVVDPVAAAAEGIVPASAALNVYYMLSGVEADTIEVDGIDMSVRLVYPEDQFDDLNKVKDIELTSSFGTKVRLKDIAEVYFEDSPASITREDKQYTVTVSASYTDLADRSSEKYLMDTYVYPNLTSGVEEKENSLTAMMNEEFSNIFTAIAVAIFLVFVVMAMQFESPRFSLMVMACIPFAMIGSMGFLWVIDSELSMISLMGFLMLVGTVVNNGILYVDTVDSEREFLPLEDALVEAGVIRLRPILMTTLTTVMGMVPMAVQTSGTASVMQGLALVDIGGMLTSTAMALLVLPVLYYYVNGKRTRRKIDLDNI